MRNTGLASVAVLAVATGVPRSSAAADARACVESAERAQTLRDEQKLLAAREDAVLCSAESCPQVVRKDCIDLLMDLRARIPSLLARARSSDGRDLPDARITIDGKPFAASRGAAIDVDPGTHTIRFESPSTTPVEQRIVVLEGERGRIVEATLGAMLTPPPPEPPRSRPVPVETWVAGGVGVLGIAGFVFFGLGARSDIDYLKSTCAPACSEDQIRYPEQKRIAADVSLLVGVVGLTVAAVTFFVSRKSPPAQRAAIAW